MANNIGNINPLIPQQNIPDLTNKKIKVPENMNNLENMSGIIADKIEISKQAKIISKALTKINEMPEIRNEIIERVREQRVVENQRVPAYLLAAKLLIEDQ